MGDSWQGVPVTEMDKQGIHAEARPGMMFQNVGFEVIFGRGSLLWAIFPQYARLQVLPISCYIVSASSFIGLYTSSRS